MRVRFFVESSRGKKKPLQEMQPLTRLKQTARRLVLLQEQYVFGNLKRSSSEGPKKSKILDEKYLRSVFFFLPREKQPVKQKLFPNLFFFRVDFFLSSTAFLPFLATLVAERGGKNPAGFRYRRFLLLLSSSNRLSRRSIRIC